MYIHFVALNSPQEPNFVQERKHGIIDFLFLRFHSKTTLMLGDKTYTITIWAKTIAGGVNLHVKNNINSGDAFVTKYFSNTEWTKLTFIVTTTNSTKSLFLNFCGAGTEQTEVVWLDDISIVETPLITNGDFESGDATGWTTNKSTSVAKEAAYSGDYGLHLVGEGNWNSMAHQTFAVTAGTQPVAQMQ